jgi:hypothetical protein
MKYSDDAVFFRYRQVVGMVPGMAADGLGAIAVPVA